MKKYLLLLSLLIIGLSSCQKVDVVAEQTAIDDAKIQAYIKANNIAATKDATTGVYYKIIKDGDASKPTIGSTVQVTYTGKLLNGETFDSGTVENFKLSGTIKGWQVALPKIGKTGRIIFLVPSTQAYGASTSGSIPGGSVLVFEVDLIGFF